MLRGRTISPAVRGQEGGATTGSLRRPFPAAAPFCADRLYGSSKHVGKGGGGAAAWERENRGQGKKKKNGELQGDRSSVFLPLICPHSPPVWQDGRNTQQGGLWLKPRRVDFIDKQVNTWSVMAVLLVAVLSIVSRCGWIRAVLVAVLIGRAGLGWAGLGWAGMGWDGMGWDGMGWDGMGWDGS